MSEKCFMCGRETDDQLVRSPLPKELLERDAIGQLAEEFHPICEDCNEFRRIVDSHFITLCEDAKLFEWYRATSKKRSEYFPSELVYNVDVDELTELYYTILGICEKAYRTSSNDKLREDKKGELNYEWRKKDD